MIKKLLFLVVLCVVPFIGTADEIATDFVILNNANSKQYADIWSRMRSGFKLDHTQTDRVKYYQRVYTKNPKYFNQLMTNAIPYLYFILNEIERNGMPTELALIPGIESSYNPLAKNPTDAFAGMWQFVPMTGRRFNMIQNDNIDERRDLVKSTRSALAYFSYLYLMFGQWDVAIGAYNWGEGGMYRAILNSNMSLGKVTYSDLQLRQITADYVPKIIALASIIENPQKFNVTLDKIPNEPYFAIITPMINTTVADVATLSNTDNNVFSKLNAQYKISSYKLMAKNNILLPQLNQSLYYANIGQAMVAANANELRLASVNSDVVLDENIKPVALVTQDTNVSVATNESATNLQLQNNQALDDLLAQLASNESSTNNIKPQSVNNTIANKPLQNNVVKYKVSSGDTLYYIANKFNADIKQIRQDNHIRGNSI